MNIIDKLVGYLAPQTCFGCGVEDFVLCNDCIAAYYEPVQPRCAGCHALSEEFKVCPKCYAWLPLQAIYISSNYDGISEQLVKALKFEQRRQAADSMSKMMSLLSFSAPNALLCPIPTAPARVRLRGFDHAQLLSKNLSSRLSLPQAQLMRRRSNIRQLGASRRSRIEQMSSEFEVIDKTRIKGKTIVLVDDVMTTGATLSAAARRLKKAGVKQVLAVIFAQKV